ncbi:MAG: hypothetical protein RBT65_14870 [Methanolobus sp.]|jgi:hypothetical protein|nr:hypothetical protein [Methanolobus sp.]
MTQNIPTPHEEKLAEISFKLMDADKLIAQNFEGFSIEKKELFISINEPLMQKLENLQQRLKNDEAISLYDLDEIEREVDGYLEFLIKIS